MTGCRAVLKLVLIDQLSLSAAPKPLHAIHVSDTICCQYMTVHQPSPYVLASVERL